MNPIEDTFAMKKPSFSPYFAGIPGMTCLGAKALRDVVLDRGTRSTKRREGDAAARRSTDLRDAGDNLCRGKRLQAAVKLGFFAGSC